MKVVKPPWLKHGGEKKDFEVYSCSVSSDGERLVSAAGDGHVRIWSIEAIFNAPNASFNGPKQLAALSYHSGTIHTVRFSPNNKYLASGADDKIVCVYYLDPNAPAHGTFGSNEAPPAENWRIHRRLIGHDNDVQDLGWSCDSSILVTVGLDSKIVVWSGHTFEKLKTISAHTSHVKGICFDPANKYFATASDDRTVKIFNYTPPDRNASSFDNATNFVLEQTIVEPFATSPLTTYFRRCSWSPDGNHIAAANSTNGPVSTAAIINRGSWDSDIHLIGHEAPVEVCAFSSRMFAPSPPRPGDDMRNDGVTVVACAGQDRNLSVWNTSNAKPFTINENMTMKSISDLAWTPDGENLFYTSLDGSIALLRFQPGELGYPLPLDVNISILAKYGASRKVGLVEGPDGLLLEELSKNDELRNVEGRMGALMGDVSSSTPSAILKANGLNGVTDGSPKVNGTIPVNDEPPTSAAIDAQAVKIQELKNRVTITKDGRKRVAPLLVSDSAGGSLSSLPQTRLLSTTQATVRADAPQTMLDLSKPFDGFPAGGLSSLLLGNKRKLAETGLEDDDLTSQRINAAQQAGITQIVMNTTEGLTSPVDAVARPSFVNSSLSVSQIRLAVPMVRPMISRPLVLFSETVAGVSRADEGQEQGHDQGIIMQVKNALVSSRPRSTEREPSRIVVTKRGLPLWQDFVPKSVVLVTGNSRFWAAASEDGSLYVWSPAGRRLFNAFALESQASILDCHGPWLLCITAVGLCHVWNIERSSSPHPPISVGPVLEMASLSQGPHLAHGPGIIFSRLNSLGRIVLAMTNGDAFSYSPSLYTWQRLSEAWWAVGSQYWNSSDGDAMITKSGAMAHGGTAQERGDDLINAENISAGIIPLLERATSSQTHIRGRAYQLQRMVKMLFAAEGYEGLESAVSLGHLENRVAGALTLGARDEFRAYLSMYAKRLGQENARLKVEELLRSLLRGMYTDGRQRNNDPPFPGRGSDVEGATDDLCGWKKSVLLREVVLILGKYRDLQRITVPYARLLGIVGASHDDADDDQVMDGTEAAG